MRRGWLRRLWVCPPLLCLPLLTGCLYSKRKLQPPQAPLVQRSADAAQLAAAINQSYNAVHSLSATVDMQATVDDLRKGVTTDYPSFRAYILLRKPQALRVLGLLPVVRTTAFDLASNGNTFRLLIPSQNKMVEGNNSVTTKSPNPLWNLRPGLFSNSILIEQIEPGDQVILTTDSNVSQDPKTKKWFEERDYLLSVVRAKDPGQDPIRELIPERVIRFNRENLQPIEQDIYDKDGNIETQALYGPLQTFGTEKFPGTIVIKRPLEKYQIVMTIQKLVLNQDLKDNQFELETPTGVQVQKLD